MKNEVNFYRFTPPTYYTYIEIQQIEVECGSGLNTALHKNI